MEIFFYKVPLCPRCLVAKRHLERILSDGEHSLHILDAFFDHNRVKIDGIRMVPAIRVQDRVLSGIWLREEKIRDFLKSVSERPIVSGQAAKTENF